MGGKRWKIILRKLKLFNGGKREDSVVSELEIGKLFLNIENVILKIK